MSIHMINGRIAVVTYTEYEKGKFCEGIQFWTKEMIEKGFSINCDPGRTVSKFVRYYEK